MSRISIRPARPGDELELEAVLLDTFESTWRPNISIEAALRHVRSNRARQYVAEHGASFQVAERDGLIVGLIHWEGDFVQALHVRGDHARTGVGGRLMDLAETAMTTAGVSAARLETDTFNLASQAFYAARGYREAGRYPDEEWGSGLTTLLLVKPLA